MIDDKEARKEIVANIGEALNDLVQERMKGLVGEPDITSRVGQRLEDLFNKKTIGGYRISVISETITSQGKKSLEKPMGTDLYFAIQIEGRNEDKVSKAIFVQAKRAEKLPDRKLAEQCRRMLLITKKGSVVWLYDQEGIGVAKAVEVANGNIQKFDIFAFLDRVFECSIGDKRKVPMGSFGDRQQLKTMLETIGAKNGVAMAFRHQPS